MPENNQSLKDLQNAIVQAKDALEEENGTGGKTFGSEAEELEYLRSRERERQEQETVRGLVAEVAAGVKVSKAEEQARLERLVASELQKALGGEQASNLVANAVARASSMRLGRKYQPDVVESGTGYKGGGAYVHGMGEKPDFCSFLRAVQRKDHAAIRDIQAAHGLTSGGGKALVSAGGAIDSVGGPSGGYLVPVEFSNEIIGRLTPQVVVRRAGARVLYLTSPVFRQPRLAGGASAGWVGETAAIASSQQTIEQFSLDCKKLAALVPVSNELLEDSSPAVSQLVMDDMARAIALKEDSTFLLGTGSTTTPAGLLTLSGINSDSVGTAPTYATILDMIYALETANVPEVNRAWVCHPTVLKAIASIVDDDHRPLFAWIDVQSGTLTQRRPTLFSYPVYTSTAMSYTPGSPNTGSLALIDFGYVALGQCRELELKVSDEASFVDGSNNNISAFQSDLSLFRATIRESIGALHPEAIVLRTTITV